MREILGKYGIICIERAGTDAKKLVYESDVLFSFSSNIWIIPEWMTNEVSSTRVRQHVRCLFMDRCTLFLLAFVGQLRRGFSIKYFVADEVIEYIKEHKLYQPVLQ